jgi:rhodanese-related sulfurtransferase
MNKNRVVLLLMFFPFIMGCNSEKINPDCLRVEKSVFKLEMKKYSDFQLIDVRTPEEYNNGTIENAENINFYDDNFNEQLSGLDKSLPTFVYCQAGGRSFKAMEVMCELGFKMVYELEGGYSNWN